MDAEIVEGLELIAREKGIENEVLVDALEAALVSAYKRLPNSAEEARVSLADTLTVYAQEYDEDGNLVREWDDTPDDFGRIAAQTAKQVLTQKLQAVERERKYEEYQGREGDIVTGIVQQKDQRFTLLDLGKVEALLPQSEQSQYERYDQGARLKAYIVEVRKTAKGPQIVVSRTHPGLVQDLFNLEVPEIADGVVEVRAIAREAGARTKIAVASNDPNVDPVGACVGARGSRVRMVVNELRGEKVDIVPYSENLQEFVSKALAPAKVREVRIDDETKTAEVIVPEFQLSLAIGKEGQNARLAARLSGLRIDIRSDQPEEPEKPEKPEAGAAPETTGEGSPASGEAGASGGVPAEGGAPAPEATVEGAEAAPQETAREPEGEPPEGASGDPAVSGSPEEDVAGQATEQATEEAAGGAPVAEASDPDTAL